MSNQTLEYRGKLVLKSEVQIAIVVSRFNTCVTQNLLQGAIEELKRHGIDKRAITIVWVPGAFEIALTAKRLGLTKQYAAIICLGAIIRGQTPHFEYISSQCAAGISQVSLTIDLPLIFGVLTTDTMEQATDRAGGKCGNKGAEAACCAIEMIDLLHSLPSVSSEFNLSAIATVTDITALTNNE